MPRLYPDEFYPPTPQEQVDGVWGRILRDDLLKSLPPSLEEQREYYIMCEMGKDYPYSEVPERNDIPQQVKPDDRISDDRWTETNAKL